MFWHQQTCLSLIGWLGLGLCALNLEMKIPKLTLIVKSLDSNFGWSDRKEKQFSAVWTVP